MTRDQFQPASISSQPARHHAILVHGTWGLGVLHTVLWPLWPILGRQRPRREVPWPLAARLVKAGLTTHTDFNWSGRNSHKSRLTAAEELAKYIEQQISVGDRVTLIAHSHGGMVAFYSLSYPAAERVQSIVCLATPFLNFSRQPFDLRIFQMLPIAAGYVGLVVGPSIWLALWALFLQSFKLSNAVVVGIMLVFMVAAGVGLYLLGKRTVSRLESANVRAQDICQKYRPVLSKGKQLLILRMVGDEASTILATGTFVELLTTFIWKTLVSLFSLRVPQLVPAWVLATAVMTIPFVVAFSDRASTAAAYALAAFFIAVFLVCVTQLGLLALTAFLSVIRFGTAKDLGATSFVRVNSEATPEGPWTIELLPGSGFAHSQVHEDDDVAERVVEWLHSVDPQPYATT